MTTVRDAALCQLVVVGHQNQGGAGFLGGPEHHLDNPLAGLAIQIAGGFVGQKQGRAGDQGAGQRHALLLSARQFRGQMTGPRAQPDGCQRLAGASKGACLTGQFQGQGNIFLCRHGRNQVEGLEDNPHIPATKLCEAVLVERTQILAGDFDPAGTGTFQPRRDREQGGFARTGGSDHGHVLATVHLQAHAAQNVDESRSTAKTQSDIGKANNGIGHDITKMGVGRAYCQLGPYTQGNCCDPAGVVGDLFYAPGGMIRSVLSPWATA